MASVTLSNTATIDLITGYFEKVQAGMLSIYPDMQDISYEVSDDGVKVIGILYGPDHIEFAERGRGPGKPPPPDKIVDWIEKEGITADGISTESLAFLIGRKMAQEGSLLHRTGKRSGVISETIKQVDIDNLMKQITEAVGQSVYSQFEKLLRA